MATKPKKLKPKKSKHKPIWFKAHVKTPAKRPRTLRDALDIIESLLDGRPFSQDLWNVLVALRGPDSRDVSLKNATTAVIRQAAFPTRPTFQGSVFRKDKREYATRRHAMMYFKWDKAHFREHIDDAFAALGLDFFEVNK